MIFMQFGILGVSILKAALFKLSIQLHEKRFFSFHSFFFNIKMEFFIRLFGVYGEKQHIFPTTKTTRRRYPYILSTWSSRKALRKQQQQWHKTKTWEFPFYFIRQTCVLLFEAFPKRKRGKQSFLLMWKKVKSLEEKCMD